MNDLEIGITTILLCLCFTCAVLDVPLSTFIIIYVLCLVAFGLVIYLEDKMKKKSKEITWYVHQDEDDLFLTTELPFKGKIYEGTMDACRGFIDGYKKRLNTDLRICKTCQNPYCSRTLEERQNGEVQAHTQYGWECVDKEKWLGSNGGFAFIKKEE